MIIKHNDIKEEFDTYCLREDVFLGLVDKNNLKLIRNNNKVLDIEISDRDIENIGLIGTHTLFLSEENMYLVTGNNKYSKIEIGNDNELIKMFVCNNRVILLKTTSGYLEISVDVRDVIVISDITRSKFEKQYSLAKGIKTVIRDNKSLIVDFT